MGLNKKGNVKIIFNKLLYPAIILVLIVGGVGMYLWRDSQANHQKNEDATIIITLESKITELNTTIGLFSINTQAGQNLIQQFSNITASANSQTALYNAQSAQSVADAYCANIGHYPSSTSDFITGSIPLPSSINPSISAPTVNNGLTTFRWEYTGAMAAPTGGRITYWDFSTGSVSKNIIYVGSATSSSLFNTPSA